MKQVIKKLYLAIQILIRMYIRDIPAVVHKHIATYIANKSNRKEEFLSYEVKAFKRFYNIISAFVLKVSFSPLWSRL